MELPSARKRLLCQLSRSEEHTSELQSQSNLVCRLLLEKKKNTVIACSHEYKRHITTPVHLAPGQSATTPSYAATLSVSRCPTYTARPSHRLRAIHYSS